VRQAGFSKQAVEEGELAFEGAVGLKLDEAVSVDLVSFVEAVPIEIGRVIPTSPEALEMRSLRCPVHRVHVGWLDEVEVIGAPGRHRDDTPLALKSARVPFTGNTLGVFDRFAP
jgi:hypothetical protein